MFIEMKMNCIRVM